MQSSQSSSTILRQEHSVEEEAHRSQEGKEVVQGSHTGESDEVVQGSHEGEDEQVVLGSQTGE